MVTAIQTIPTQFQRVSMPVVNGAVLYPQSLCECVQKVFKSIGSFFYNRYADTRLFFRAVFSMGSSADHSLICQRALEISEFKAKVEYLANSGCLLNILPELYSHLSASAKGLLFTVDESLIRRCASTVNPLEIRQLKEEIVRDCNRAYSFQHSPLILINRASRVFSRNPSAHSAVNMEIPGTLRYDRDQIPQAVAERAEAITSLVEGYRQRLGNAFSNFIPSYMIDNGQVIRIPVFDASHPHLDHPAFRHAVDSFTMNRNMHECQQGNCTHPRNRSIDPDHLLIDVELQQRILNWLQSDQFDIAVMRHEQSHPRVIPHEAHQRSRRRASDSIATTTAPAIPINRAVPGTVAYIRDQIPPEVQAKAERIKQLEVRYGLLFDYASSARSNYPHDMRRYCVSGLINLGILSLPVFDVSHPDLQRVLNAPADSPEAARIGQRHLRHLREAADMEFELAFRSRLHPHSRDNLLIDTAFQDEIIQFLERAISTRTAIRERQSAAAVAHARNAQEAARARAAWNIPTVPRVVAAPIRPSAIRTVPDTVPYVSGRIPPDVQTKANEIERLYDALPSSVTNRLPNYMTDVISRDVISIPVFDVSHPAVQTALRAPPGSPEAARINRPVDRHALNPASIDGLINNNAWNSRAVCPQCRHPETEGRSARIDRANLLIDTGLQDQILQWLRNPPSSSATTN